MYIFDLNDIISRHKNAKQNDEIEKLYGFIYIIFIIDVIECYGFWHTITSRNIFSL